MARSSLMSLSTRGANCEITPPGSKEVKHNVTLCGIKNIPRTYTDQLHLDVCPERV